MLLTEEEARNVVCCVPIDGEKRSNGVFCIASKCMAWRWDKYTDFREYDLHSKATGEKIAGGLSIDTEWRLTDPDEPDTARYGYCGLASKPGGR